MASPQVGVGNHDNAAGSEAQKVRIVNIIFHVFLSLESYTNLVMQSPLHVQPIAPALPIRPTADAMLISHLCMKTYK
jgi:hypothetical protein